MRKQNVYIVPFILKYFRKTIAQENLINDLTSLKTPNFKIKFGEKKNQVNALKYTCL